MRNLTTTLCLTIAVLLGSAGESVALPECPGSPAEDKSVWGQWHNCEGIIPLSNGMRFEGEIRNGLPYGQGTLTFSAPHKLAGEKQVGEYRNDKLNGQGTVTYSAPHKSAGEKQVGEFKDAKLHGQGTVTVSAPHKHAGIKQVGEYRNGKLHGQGTVTYSAPHKSAGAKYVGEYKDGKKNGQGTYTFADGRVKEGRFENDKFKYAQKVTPPVIARKSPPPSPSAAEIENKKLQKRIAELEKQKQSKPKQVAKRPPPKKSPPPKSATSGSGFFVSKLGHVITNQHIVDDCKKVTVGDNAKKQVTADILETDRRNDLALLKISSMQMASAETKSLIRKLGITVVPLASDGLLRSEDVELGERVLVAGYPYGEIFSNTIKVTGGMVSANRGLGDDTGQFQMDAAVQPGNSGGPIYDENGNIVGVVVAQLNKMKFAKTVGSIPENVNFGIKASTVRQFLTSSGLPTKWSKRSKSMSTRELAKIAKNQTVMVVCHQ